MSEQPTLLFVSTRFLFPVDSGGKIRTTQVLRGLKGGRYRIQLVSPATDAELERHAEDLSTVCDEFTPWTANPRGTLFNLARARFLADRLPIPIRTDWSAAGRAVVDAALARRPDVAVFDFLHAAVLAPEQLRVPSVMFTHNVETEIFARHLQVARNPLMRAMWRSQHGKMRRFETLALRRFDVVVAVSDRDAKQFSGSYAVKEPFVIPTGVDLDFFCWAPPSRDREIVFCGSMDWLANQDGIDFFLDEIWARIVREVPDARMTVVGRAPPAGLVERARRFGDAWSFTGFVDDVRPHLQGAAVSVIPLRVGGGTRLKVFEAMAMGSPVVSTTLGVEGLPVTPGEHFLQADDPEAFAGAVVGLLRDPRRRDSLSAAARELVESRFSYRAAAQVFEQACELARTRRASAAA